MANWRARGGLNPTHCDCGAGLRGRERRCTPCRAEADRLSHVQRRYGLTPEEYNQLVVEADGRCQACGEEPPRSGSPSQRHLHVDHDHDTGMVRGLLCYGCNLALGLVQDDPAKLRGLIAYLEE